MVVSWFRRARTAVLVVSPAESGHRQSTHQGERESSLFSFFICFSLGSLIGCCEVLNDNAKRVSAV